MLPPPTVDARDIRGLSAALNNPAISRIVLAPGEYTFAYDGNCPGATSTWFCIGRSVAIEAAEPGTVELNAMGQGRVFVIAAPELAVAPVAVELIGLNITGGYTSDPVSGSLIETSPAARPK